MGQDNIWIIVGVVFIAEFVLPPIGAGVRWCWAWLRDLRDLREDLYEPEDDEDYEDED